MELEIFNPHSVVRIKSTGAFGEIKSRCSEPPIQYEVWIYNEKGEIVTRCFDHQMLELEWVSPIEYVSSKPEDIETLAEIIVNILLEDPKIIEQRLQKARGKY